MQTVAPKANQQGASLIEALVAALILALGMLALVGVQASSTQIAALSQMQQEAARIGQSASDRIRANINSINDYSLTQEYSGNAQNIAVPAACDSSCDAAATRTKIKDIDMAELRNGARQVLPQGDIRIVVRANQTVDIWVLWQQATTSTDGNIGGTGCPAQMVAANTTAQCLLTRVAL